MLKHHLNWRSAVFLVAVPAAVVAAVGTASASLNTNGVETVANGSAGYSVTSGDGFANAGVTITPDAAFGNIGQPTPGSNTGGGGMQLCDPNSGFGGQLGLVAENGGKKLDVEYAVGTLAGAAVDNCVGNPLLSGAVHIHSTTLDGINVTDQVDLYISFRNVKVTTRHPGHWTSCKRHGKTVKDCHWHKAYDTTSTQGRMKFQAQDDTAGFEVYSSPWIATAADWNLDEAGFGVEQDTNGLSADSPTTVVGGTPAYNGVTGPNKTGAHTPLASFSDAFVNGFGIATVGHLPIGVYTSHEVATTGNGLNANPATSAPNNTGLFNGITGSFTDDVGNVIS